MGELIGFLTASVIIEGVVSYITSIVEKKSIDWKIVVAIIFGVLIAANLNLDFFKLLGLSEKYSIIGTVLTGVLSSRGSNYIFELYDKLTGWKKGEKVDK